MEQPSRTGDGERVAAVLGAFTYASDLAFGFPFEDGLRACYIAMRLADRLNLSPADRKTVFYTVLIKEAGCTCWTNQLAEFWQADEMEARRELLIFGAGSDLKRFAPWMLRYVGTQLALPARVARLGDVFFRTKSFLREGFDAVCEVNARIAGRLGMPEAVQLAIQSMFERWDGGGVPRGLRGTQTPIAARIVAGCFYFIPFKDLGGHEAARRFARDSRGTLLDPAVADAFLALSQEASFWEEVEAPALWDHVLALEPEPIEYSPGPAYLDEVAGAFADFVDLKSPYAAAHSRRVATLAESVAVALGCGDTDAAWIRRAALMHDLGQVAVSSFTLGRAESAMSESEREQFRLHPYHGERVLMRVPALQPAAAIVGAHHERLDGTGYYRGLKGTAIPLGARIVAAVDQFDELAHDRPGRRAMPPGTALTTLEAQAGRAFDPGVLHALRSCVQAETSQTGALRMHAHVRQVWPAGLTDREVEVLRLAARGQSRKQIAAELVISEVTARHHLEHIYRKAGVSTRVGASMFAMEAGIIV
ncbi:MAG: HD domain-containing phosphohydrolase [Tepidiformaceae bacterium]